MQKSVLDEAKNIHFIGIGGIGISAIARMLLLEGKNVSGSDMSESKAVEELRKFGAKRNLMKLTYPETLKEISKNKYTIAVSGTHGKTTTTAMIAKIMIDAGLDPTVIVGSFLKDHKSNFIAGKSKYF